MHNNKLNSINVSYLNLAAQSPSLELNLALSEKVHRTSPSNTHVFFMCDRALSSCSVNLLNKKSICDICRYKAKKGYEVFKERNPNSKLIKLTREDLSDINTDKLGKDNIDEILLGVHSTIGSQLRLDNMNLLNKKWRKIKNKMFNSSVGMFNYFNLFLKKNKVNNFIIFNGRLSCARPLVKVAKENRVSYKLFDASVNGKIPMYSTNEMFHSISFEKNNALKTYVKFFKESKSIAEEYMFKKRNALETNDFAYTGDQKYGFIEKRVQNLAKPIISIFVSSDDEYRFIGSDWAKFGLEDQTDSITKIINSDLKNNYDFVVKMHPNQKNIHVSIMERYLNLSNDVLVLFPNNKTDTYALIQKSEIVINFCSTVGAEANYLRKPVVQIGASRFRLLPVANYVKNAIEAINIIKSKEYKVMPLRASVVYFCYHGKTQFKLDSYKFLEDGVYSYGGKLIKAKAYMRYYAIFDKLYQSYIRGDRDLFSKLSLYIPNLIFGTNKVR
tara:strand:+ start:691 stop:2190 length:1500 start_codon:yes stop_codon:yes gene_type:complete